MMGYHALHDSHAARLRDALSISLTDLRLAERNANQERERMLLALPQPVGVPVGAPHRLLHRRARHHQRVVAAWEAQGNLHRRGRAHLSGADELRDEPRHLCRTQARSAFVAGFVVGSCEASFRARLRLPQAPARLSRSAGWAVFMLAGRTGLGFDMSRYLGAVEHLQQARVGRRGAPHTADLAERKGQPNGISRSADLQICRSVGPRFDS